MLRRYGNIMEAALYQRIQKDVKYVQSTRKEEKSCWGALRTLTILNN